MHLLIIYYHIMKVINLSKENSILKKFLAEIRDVNYQKNPLLFRNNIKRIGQIMAYEISKNLNYESKTITTPLDTIETEVLKDKVVLSTIFRAGLPLHEGFLSYFDDAENAFVSAYRYYKDKESTEVGIKVEYLATPSLSGKTLFIIDPMLATGGSIDLAYQALITKGMPERIIIACVIGCKKGVENLKKLFPNDNVELYVGAIDPILNEHKYIVPGLGDAGDLMYGEKL